MISKPVCAPDSVPSLRCTFHYKKGRTPEEVMPILLQRISSAALDANAAKCAHAAHGAQQVLPMRTVPTAHTAFSDRQLLGCRAWAPLVCTKYCPKGKRGKRVPHDSSPSPFTTGWGKTHDIIGLHEREIHIPRALLPSFLSYPVVLPVRPLEKCSRLNGSSTSCTRRRGRPP